MAVATGAGALLAVAIRALTDGLIRSESASDLRILTDRKPPPGLAARSPPRRARPRLGALLGVAGAYIVLSATYDDNLDY